MASALRAVRLRMPSFTSIPFTGSGDTGKDLIFILRCDKIRRLVSDGVIAFPNPRWRGGVIAPLNTIQYQITLTGSTYERGHVDHPVTTATEHDPDLIDLEEAIIAWNGAAPGGPIEGPNALVHLETDFNGNIWRIYQGLILKATLVRMAGHTEALFEITFGVLFEATTYPGIREWS